MTWWLIEHDGGELEQVADAPGTMGNPEGVRSAELPRALDLSIERWDWDESAIVSRFTPAEAYGIQWELAKAHSNAVGSGGFDLVGVGPIQTDVESLTAIRLLVEEARDRIADGEAEWATEFLNRDNVKVPVSAPQILMINRLVRFFFGAIYDARQATRDQLTAALEADATADEIFAIDITAGYPAGPISPPTPPEEES
jgi:hypothetical protein